MKQITLIAVIVLILGWGGLNAIQHTIGLRGGASYPFADRDDENNLNLMGGLTYEAWLKDYLSLGIDPYYTKLSGEGSDVEYDKTVIGGDLNVKYRPISPTLSLNFRDSWVKRISPFVNLGLGISHYDNAAGDGKINISAPSAGLGASIQTRSNINFDLGVKWVHVLDDKLDNFEANDFNDHYLMPYLGIGFTFPKKAEESTGDPFSTLLRDRISMTQNFTLRGVQFESGSAELTPNAKVLLNDVVAELKANPNVKIEIQGHTDNTGTEELNNRLSLERANSVKSYLVAAGIEANRLRTSGWGFRRPIDTNDTPEGRANNRRIEFIILK